MDRFAREWWLNLNDALTTSKYMDTANIHRFDPPSKHRGGAGVTGLLEEGTAASKINKCVNPLATEQRQARRDKQGCWLLVFERDLVRVVCRCLTDTDALSVGDKYD